MSDNFPFDVFLSHNSNDKPRVRRLAERLKGAGLRVWLDEWVIQPGDIISRKVDEGLEQSRVLLLCLSPAALASDWVALERSTAIHREPANAGRRFIPLLLADCKLPDTLRRYKYVDFHEEAEGAFAELLRTGQPEAGEASTSATGRAFGWLAALGEPELPVQRPGQPQPTSRPPHDDARAHHRITQTLQRHRLVTVGKKISRTLGLEMECWSHCILVINSRINIAM
jgi:hypothetical protein